jgi:hypothetical protein
MKSLLAVAMALAAVFAFTSTTAASAASKQTELEALQREVLQRDYMEQERCIDFFEILYKYDPEKAGRYLTACLKSSRHY